MQTTVVTVLIFWKLEKFILELNMQKGQEYINVGMSQSNYCRNTFMKDISILSIIHAALPRN